MSRPQKLRSSEKRLLELLMDRPGLTPAELTRLTGHTRSWVWKNLASLREKGLVTQEGRGHSSRLLPSPDSYRAVLRLGLLRASEYPYAVPLTRFLHDISGEVQVSVYDDAFTLATHLAEGRIHLAFAPLITLLLTHRASGGRVVVIGGGSRGGSGIVYHQGVFQPATSPHATTMASTMEYCAEKHGLRGPRVYAKGGEELLSLLRRRRVHAAVVWEPYLTRAVGEGFHQKDCGVEFCCVLGAHRALEPVFPRVTRLFEKAVSNARARRVDLESYARMVGLEPGLVARTVSSYEFFEEPPLEEARRNMTSLMSALLPPRLLHEAFYQP